MFTDLRIKNSVTESQKEAILNPHYSFAIKKQNFLIKIATSIEELKHVFRLRKKVYSAYSDGFNEEFDFDQYDLNADHLLVIDQNQNKIVGTYRLLLSDKVTRHYAEREFDLTQFKALSGRKLELGRACVDTEMRSGVIITLLWRGIAEYLKLSNASYLFGCSTIWGATPEETFLIYRYLVKENLISHLQINPLPKSLSSFWTPTLTNTTRLSETEIRQALELIPALVKTYIRMGMKFSAPPAFDPKLQSFEFFGYIKIDELDPGFKKKYLQVPGSQ